jgi:hypothetical protein
VRWRAHQSSASGRSGAPKLTGGGVKGREEKKQGKVRCYSGVVLTFYRGRGEHWGGVARVVNAGVNGFNAIEDGGGFKREIKGGEMKVRW